MIRIALIIAGALVLVLGFAGIAHAATPQDIYNDYAADGDLDGDYTDEELQAYLDDAIVHQYGDDNIVSELDRLVKDLLTGQSGGTRPSFPFTGAELLAIVLAALVLLTGGIVLRRAPTR